MRITHAAVVVGKGIFAEGWNFRERNFAIANSVTSQHIVEPVSPGECLGVEVLIICNR
jgi:hypothetical protein